MKKVKLLTMFSTLAWLLPNITFADSDINYDTLLSAEPTLNKSTTRALDKLKDWRNDLDQDDRFYIKHDGSVVFDYGTQIPAIVCSILNITDLELEQGEIVKSVNIGDSSRWSIQAAVTGEGPSATQHLLIKPFDVGLETSMLVATDRRAYHINLKSTRSNYMPIVRFTYPEKQQAILAQQELLRKQELEKNSLAVDANGDEKTYLGNLNFNYEVEGSVSWKPVRIYDDGKKTIIEMPKEVLNRTAPSLLILEEEEGIFSDEKTRIINYRLQNTKYIVDGIFNTAILTMGIDNNQERIIIKRIEK